MADLVWYVAYGSNLHADRLHYYLAGGRPAGAARTYPGSRDPRPPRRTTPVFLPGGIYFALESRTWTGGMAFYDPALPGRAAARGYLVTAGQFADIAAQEMGRTPDADLDLAEALGEGLATLGPGRYETLVSPGHLDDHPMLTFTAPWACADIEPAAPAPRYLGLIAGGLAEAHGWDPGTVTDYLAERPGVRGHWTRDAVADRVASVARVDFAWTHTSGGGGTSPEKRPPNDNCQRTIG
ncbi:histone deacetylase [Cryptosporangium sp. NPDC051539]|uniref:histone deacetylase n=1 Tax=Cryptosporangium sp. NPDC051539 TaxID=3363962 RepID=UPI0037A4B460